MRRVFHRQPGAGAVFLQHWRGGQFGGESIEGDRLQMIFGSDARQEYRHRHCAIRHVALVGNVVDDLHGLRIRMFEQVGGLPNLAGVIQFDRQLRGRNRQADQQGEEGED